MIEEQQTAVNCEKKNRNEGIVFFSFLVSNTRSAYCGHKK